jgi:hypothetical protein
VGGEWADEPTWTDILSEEGCENPDDGRADLFDVYCFSFARGAEDEIVRSAHGQL